MLKTAGIHHITAMVNDAQRTIDFYASVLGLRLVKKTINFDRPEVYHLYFGDKAGNPGTVITFFPWEKQLKGRIGMGQVGVISFSIPKGSFPYWKNRLETFDIPYEVTNRFGESYMQFIDPDGLVLELVDRDTNGDHEILGFAGTTLISAQPNKTAVVLESMLGFQMVGEEEGYLRFKSSASIGNIVDIKLLPSVRGLMGAGTVHHIAWRASDESELSEWKMLLERNGYHPTEIKDRNYFKAIYFHEGGGILFEIATDPPGFTVDEHIEHLGESLQLPSWLEEKRKELEEMLPSVQVRTLKGEE